MSPLGLGAHSALGREEAGRIRDNVDRGFEGKAGANNRPLTGRRTEAETAHPKRLYVYLHLAVVGLSPSLTPNSCPTRKARRPPGLRSSFGPCA